MPFFQEVLIIIIKTDHIVEVEKVWTHLKWLESWRVFSLASAELGEKSLSKK